MDLLIKGGLIVDGSGKKPFIGNVLINRDIIVEIGKDLNQQANRVIDATGLVVTPGFIDGHTHSELNILRNRQQPNAIYQGVTTVVTGQCGLGFAPLSEDMFDETLKMNAGIFLADRNIFPQWNSFGELLRCFEKSAVNVGANVSHNAIRQMVIGFSDKPLQKRELEAACRHLERAMEEGALGLSVGLSYYPGGFSNTEELIALCRVVKKYNGVFCVHLRLGEEENELSPVQEVIKIVEETSVRLNMLHYKSGDMTDYRQLLDPFKKLEDMGMEIHYEYYPYLVGAGLVLALIPGWVQEGGYTQIINKLKDIHLRSRLIQEINTRRKHFFTDNQTATISITKDPYSLLIGKTLEEVAKERNMTYAETVIHLLIENDLEVGFVGKESCSEELRKKLYDDQYKFFTNERYTVGSDSIPDGVICHPRVFGTFPKIIKQMRERKVPIEFVIKKLTSYPAHVYNICDRGLLTKGYKADICIMNYSEVEDCATFENARVHPKGIKYVFVNGLPVVSNGTITGMLSGRSIRRIDSSKITL